MSHEIKLNGFWYKPDDRIAKMTLEQCLDHAENAIAWDERGDSITTLNDCINRIRELHDLTRWIPVEERLPDNEGAVRVWVGFETYGKWCEDSNRWFVDGSLGRLPVTHWQHITTPILG